MITVELLKGWNGNSAGTVLNIEMNGVAMLLIDRGVARRIEPPKRPKKLQVWVKKHGSDNY